MPKYTPEQQIAAFWNKVDKDGSAPSHMPHLGKCWEWTANINQFGYGNKTWNKKSDKAHRVSWMIAYGAIPDGLWVLHKCDNRRCVNPEHLFLGTQKDNIEDMNNKKRSNFHKGKYQGIEKLTRKHIDEILTFYNSGDASQSELSIQYKLSIHVISFIVHFKDW